MLINIQEEFNLTIDQMSSIPCNQQFVFGPSRRYVSTSKVYLLIITTRKDGKEDDLTVPTYLVDAEVPFLCGKKTLEDWNFQISGRDKILEITSFTDGSRIQIQMIDTQGGHYGIVLETQRKQNVLYIEDALGDELGILFLEDQEEELCSFKAVRQVHKINRHKQKDQLIAAHHNAGWMSLELGNVTH